MRHRIVRIGGERLPQLIGGILVPMLLLKKLSAGELVLLKLRHVIDGV